MGNKFDRDLAHVARREQVWENLVNRLGKSISVADLDIMFTYLGTDSLQFRTVDYLLSESLKVAKGAEKMGVNDGCWGKCEADMVATKPEAAHTVGAGQQVGGNHYAGKVQHWDWAIAVKLGPMEYAATKYIGRHTKKGGLEDLKKAVHHLEKLIEVEYGRRLTWKIE